MGVQRDGISLNATNKRDTRFNMSLEIPYLHVLFYLLGYHITNRLN